jgi:hypothetical protein
MSDRENGNRRGRRRRFSLALGAGVAVRVAVWAALFPLNNDDHLGVITWILRHGFLPTSEVGNQTFQPPLYYLLALPWTIGRSLKFLQAFSLLLSLANLLVLHGFLRRTLLLRSDRARRQALWLVALLPQFVIFGNFVSNDALAFLVGTLLLIQAIRYLHRPDTRSLLLLAAISGAGLLAKGTFLGFLPVPIVLILAAGARRRWSVRARASALLLFCAVSLFVGSYKFLENMARFGRPVVHNMDFHPPWMARQQRTYRGVRSFLDADLLRLVGEPFGARALSAYPTLLYATFWYSYIPESNFRAVRARVPALAGAIAGGALLPTTVILIGVAIGAYRCRALGRPGELSEDGFRELAGGAALLLGFLGNLSIVLAAGVKYRAWSCFQGRLLFPSILAIAIFLGWGLDLISLRLPRAARAVEWGLVAVNVLLAAYLVIEVVSALGIPGRVA